MSEWLVVSPEYGETVPILDDGTGPMEYGCDVVEVEADSKREALVAGVRAMRHDPACHWLRDHNPDRNPFTGMKVYPKEGDENE